jgi:hypothetical protein
MHQSPAREQRFTLQGGFGAVLGTASYKAHNSKQNDQALPQFQLLGTASTLRDMASFARSINGVFTAFCHKRL